MSRKMLLLSWASQLAIWLTIVNFCCVLMVTSDMRVGPWGGQGGKRWAYEPNGDISQITVTYDDVVHSICFTSTDANGNLDKSKLPCKEAGKTAEINIDVKNEKLNGISGTYDNIDKCSKSITSLSFSTNSNKTYGPYGTVKGTAFSLVVEDEGFTGFYGRTGWVLNNIGVSLGIRSITGNEDVGPLGEGGWKGVYDFPAKGEISRIQIQYGNAIRWMIITSQDENGVLYTSRKIGGETPPPAVSAPFTVPDYPDDKKMADIVLDVKNGEKLVGLSGTYGFYEDYYAIKSLEFETNKGKTYGPYGVPGWDVIKDFSFKSDNGYITGFFGGDYVFLMSIGIHVQTGPKIFREWGDTTTASATPWRYNSYNAGISHISLTYYKDAIYSIIFTSADGNSTKVNSTMSGNTIGTKKAEIDIDPKNEKLIGISGTVGDKKGSGYITSLSFLTDNNRTFGPYGSQTGTAFSTRLKDGYISGFHGRSEKWLRSIGIYVMPI